MILPAELERASRSTNVVQFSAKLFKHENYKKKKRKKTAARTVNEVNHVHTKVIPCKYHVTPVKRKKNINLGQIYDVHRIVAI